MMEFIKDIHEARMTRGDNNLRVLTYTDCCERLYLSLLALEIMRHYPNAKDNVQRYAKRSTSQGVWTRFSTFNTDLYNLIYFVKGDKEAMDKLKDPGAALKMRKQTTLPQMALNRYLTQLSMGNKPTDVNGLFMKLEREMRITNTNYKGIRRFATNILSSQRSEKEQWITQLVYAFRAKLRNSDLIDDFEKFVSSKSLEIEKAIDNEPKVSVPDITTDGADLLYYRFLVGQENLILAKEFLKRAKDGTTIPAQFVKGYIPAIEILDDIVKAGPAYIQSLRAVHKRAKNSLK